MTLVPIVSRCWGQAVRRAFGHVVHDPDLRRTRTIMGTPSSYHGAGRAPAGRVVGGTLPRWPPSPSAVAAANSSTSTSPRSGVGLLVGDAGPWSRWFGHPIKPRLQLGDRGDRSVVTGAARRHLRHIGSSSHVRAAVACWGSSLGRIWSRSPS